MFMPHHQFTTQLHLSLPLPSLRDVGIHTPCYITWVTNTAERLCIHDEEVRRLVNSRASERAANTAQAKVCLPFIL